MSITPAELRQVRFAQVRRGYDTEAVDRALEAVIETIEALQQERQELTDRVRRLEGDVERYREVESTLTETLALAEKAAAEVRSEAQAEAERLLAVAREKAASAPEAEPGRTTDRALAELLDETRSIRALLLEVLGREP